jgi:hypothetical protein
MNVMETSPARAILAADQRWKAMIPRYIKEGKIVAVTKIYSGNIQRGFRRMPKVEFDKDWCDAIETSWDAREEILSDPTFKAALVERQRISPDMYGCEFREELFGPLPWYT